MNYGPNGVCRRYINYLYTLYDELDIGFLNPKPTHVPYGLRGLPPGCGRSVTDF
jgi:hypothetical protein